MPLTPLKKIEDPLFVWGEKRSSTDYMSLDADIEALFALDLSTASDDEISTALDRVGSGFVTRSAYGVTPTSFRARRAEKLWAHTDDLVAPRPEKVGIGRFNEAGKPVRYFASDPHTALLELRPQPRERFVVMVQKYQLDHSLPLASFGIPRLPPMTGPYSQLVYDNFFDGLAAEEHIVAYGKEHGTEGKWLKQNAVFDRLATDYYADTEAKVKYRLTCMLGQAMLSMEEAVGLAYPTAQNNYMDLNIALPEQVAKSALLPAEAWLVEIGDELEPPHMPKRRGERLHRYHGGRVIERGTIDAGGNVTWGNKGDWCPHALHKEIAPVPGVKP